MCINCVYISLLENIDFYREKGRGMEGGEEGEIEREREGEKLISCLPQAPQ